MALKPSRKVTSMGLTQLIQFLAYDPIHTTCVNVAADNPRWLNWLAHDQYQMGLMALLSLVIAYFVKDKEDSNGSGKGTNKEVAPQQAGQPSSNGGTGPLARAALRLACLCGWNIRPQHSCG